MARQKQQSGHPSKAIEQFPLFNDRTIIDRYWQSSLFDQFYLRNDLRTEYKDKWDDIESLGFANFLNGFTNLCLELQSEDPTAWSETDTINKWIKHVMRLLGWHGEYANSTQTPFVEEHAFTVEENAAKKTYRPDLLYFEHPTDANRMASIRDTEKRLIEAQQYVAIPLEAKYWNRLEEYRQGKKESSKRIEKRQQDSLRTLAPDDQTFKYIEILKKDFGILTDGYVWRLFHRELSSDSVRRCYQFNLGMLREHVQNGVDEPSRRWIYTEAAKYFYFFFSKDSLFKKSKNDIRFVDEILEFSKKNATKVEEDLKLRFIQAMNIACNGIQKSVKLQGTTVSLDQIRTVAESHLFNILFIKYCESRQILPMASVNYRKISLSKIIDHMDDLQYDPDRDAALNDASMFRSFSGDFKYTPEGTEIYDRLVRLTLTVLDGTSNKDNFGFEIVGFKETVFTKEECKFVKRFPISNRDMLAMLFELGFTRKSEVKEKKFQQIPYNSFSVRQLGSIYESFLEFRLEEAKENLAFWKKQWQPIKDVNSAKVKKEGCPIVKKGELFFTPDNKDRKATGSYYTPDCIVQYSINKTLRHLVSGKRSSEILEVKICDPAMGSGHFLSAAVNYLSDAYLAALDRETPDAVEALLPEVKRIILDNCIFGVDINPRAVKLAKMSLWLESAHINKKLGHLDDQIKSGNSIMADFSWDNEFKNVFAKGGFDVIVGNPPYVFTRGMNFTKEEKEHFKSFKTGQGKLNTFALFFEKSADLVKKSTGQICFICPSNLLRTTTYVDLRKFLLANCKIAAIIQPNFHVFAGVTAETVVVLIDNGYREENTRVIEIDEALNERVTNTFPQSIFEKNVQTVFSINMSKQFVDLFYEVRKRGKALHGFCDWIMEGIVTQKDKGKYIADHPVNSKYKKLLEGKDISNFTTHFDKKYIHYDRKILHRARPEEIFLAKKKILIQRISGGKAPIVAAFDDDQHYTFASLNNVILKSDYDGWYLYFTAVLNSKLINAYYALSFTNCSNLTVNISGTYLDELPIVLSEKVKAPVDALVKKIIGARNDNEKRRLRDELDQLIYKAYGLSKEDIKLVETLYSESASN